jgi:Peptidase family M1 domain
MLMLASCAGTAQQPQVTHATGSAEALYLKLRSVGLDKARIYKVREASIDHASLHISLDDGTIGFTEDAAGKITGAFFTGFGEALLSPPNMTERASLAFFTGAAILEEKFSTAYLRFNDDLFAELKPHLRDAEDPDTFFSAWNLTARNLSEQDALRLLLTFSESLPPEPQPQSANDHFLHAFLQGNKFGTFDVRYDSLAPEQISAGQHKRVEGQDFYDVWTSFRVPGIKNTEPEDGEQVETPAPGFVVTSTNIRAEVRPPTQLEADADVRVTVREGGKRTLLFELSRLLEVKEVKADQQPVEFIHNQAIEGSQLSRRGNDVIAVILPRPLHAGQKLALSFKYSGAVISEAANGLLYVGERGTWYPNPGFQMSRFSMEFRYPAGWTLVATGRRTANEPDGAMQISRWISERPVPVAGFNLGKYSQTVTRAGNIPIITYATASIERPLQEAVNSESSEPDLLKRQRARAFPIPRMPDPSPSSNLQTVGAASAKALEFYERLFGPFPFSQLSITQMPGNQSQGWPGLVFLSSYAFLSPQDKQMLERDPVRRAMAEQVVAHETAHQWWGDLVSWSGYRDQWISEGLSNYSALMLLETHDPAKFHVVMERFRNDLLAKNPKGVPLMDAGPVTLGLRLSSSQLPGGYEAISYGRGTWLFHMLRSMMRDAERKAAKGNARPQANEPFLRALRKLRNEYEGRPVSTAELMAIFESELPSALWYEGRKSLNWFYQGWVYGKSVPQFSVHNLKFADRPNGTTVSGTIVQDDAPDDLVTAVPLYTVVRGKQVFAGQVFAEGHEAPFRLALPPGARKVIVDPEQTLLARR